MIRAGAGAAAALLALAAGPAAAHGGLAGGGFLSGALHPLVAVEHLILLVALGLMSGRLPRERRGPGFAALGLGLLGGLALGAVGLRAAAPVAILALACGTGGLVALAPRAMPAAVAPALAGVAGLAVGLDSDVASGVAPVAGLAAGVYLVVLDAAALAAVAVRPPFPVAVRIAGSWVAAIAFMLLALALADTGGAA